MKKFLKLSAVFLKKYGMAFGNAVSTIFLVVFYFTFFAIFAIPFAVMRLIYRNNPSTYYIDASRGFSDKSDFLKEF